jgi:hypothetical protein
LASWVVASQSLDLVGHPIVACIEMMQVAGEIVDHIHHSRRQQIGAIGEDVRKRMAQEAQALADGDAALEQNGSDLDSGALADQTRTHSMQRLQVELVDTLCGNKTHGGPLRCLSHGFGITEVVLLALEEGLHELRRH